MSATAKRTPYRTWRVQGETSTGCKERARKEGRDRARKGKREGEGKKKEKDKEKAGKDG